MFMLFGVLIIISPPAFKLNPFGLVSVTPTSSSKVMLNGSWLPPFIFKAYGSIAISLPCSVSKYLFVGSEVFSQASPFFLAQPVIIGASLLSFGK